MERKHLKSMHLLISLILLLTLLLLKVCTGNIIQTTERNGLCTSRYIRNEVSDLERLRGCRVIEGNLQISLIDQLNNRSSGEYGAYSFPELREISGYFLLTWAPRLRTLRNLFPNLAVIRGQELVYHYSLVIYDMSDMHEIGLPSLTNILNHGVYISNNPNLCYVDTIDWSQITNHSSVNIIQKNKPSEECPNKCPKTCSKAETGLSLCWSHSDCQIVHRQKCGDKCGGGPCSPSGECCDKQCLGGCSGPTSGDCFVCKNVEVRSSSDPMKFICTSHCPNSYYKYLNRRCVTESECQSIRGSDPKKKGHGKRLENYDGEDVCVLECPKSYSTVIENDIEVCKPCDGHCKKVCPGKYVDSVESSESLKGCTKVNGTLKIQIRGYSPNLVKELEQNMDMIEEIDGSLVVANSHSLSSLNFLKSLRVIHGNILEEDIYAVVVKSNENIQELWSRSNIIVSSPHARVLFHYNPKLCPSFIHSFVRSSTISPGKEGVIDIGITNGDEVPCNKTELDLLIKKRTNSSVTIQWENFRRNLTDPRHLLNYEVYYKVSPSQTVSLYETRDPCGKDDWKVIDVPRMSFNGSRAAEPKWQGESLITGLLYYTQYAIYVKTVVIPDQDSPNHNIAAQSKIKYFTTLPGVPSHPLDVSVGTNSSEGIIILWQKPESPNGIIEKYEIFMKEEIEDSEFQDQRDYCKGRPEMKLGKKDAGTSFMQTLSEMNNKQNSDLKECCSCSSSSGSKSPPTPLSERKKFTLFENQVEDAIINSVFIPNPNFNETSVNLNELDANLPNERRKKREAFENDTILVGEDSREISSNFKTFPYNALQPDITFLKYANMKLVVEIFANQTSVHDGRLIYFLGNLTHFRRYTVGIRACRNTSEDIENDTRVCSEIIRDTVTTKPSESADIISFSSIRINVTGNEVRFSWDEPKEPNGIVMSYKINVTRVDSSKTIEPPHISCITRKLFNESGRNFTFPKEFHPGNYSVRIQVISLAPLEANFTEPKYFIILASAESRSSLIIILVVGFLALILLLLTLFAIFCYNNKKALDKITSANPEYKQNVDIPAEFEIPREKVEIFKELGKGSFGTVYEGLIRDYNGVSKRKVAVKQVGKGAPSEERWRFLQEANIMTQTKCHHVISLIGVVSLTQPTLVIMELMLHGDLKNYLRKRRPLDPSELLPPSSSSSSQPPPQPPPTLRQILRMAAGIADGMAYLDSKGFVHRDLAARNCMVADDLTVKVGDFGMTKDTDYYRKSSRGLLPVRWMAPESIKDGIFTIQSDLWSFGVVLWEMATLAAQPYQGLNNDQVIRYVKEGGIMERPENCPEILYSLMLQCWAYRPLSRPTFVDLLDHLVSDLEPSFAEVSFYHSTSGVSYRNELQNRRLIRHEEYISAKTPLKATFEEDFMSEEEGGLVDSDEEDPTLLRHGEDIHGNEVSFRGVNNGILFTPSHLPSAFHKSNELLPSQNISNNRPNQNNTSPTPSPPDFIALDLNVNLNSTLNNSNNKNNSQISPLKGQNLNYVPSGETNLNHLCNGAGPSPKVSPLNHSSSLLNTIFNSFPREKNGVNGYLLPPVKQNPVTENHMRKNSSTTQF